MLAWLEGIEIVGPLGDGSRCTAWKARRGFEALAVKHFKCHAVLKHASRHAVPLARFEFDRNCRLYSAPGLRANIARPVAMVDDGPRQILIQELIVGVPITDFASGAGERERRRIYAQLGRIVSAAHDASVYDLDLHSNNILVARGSRGRHKVVLFDFNKIPYHERPPNVVVGYWVKRGWIGSKSRDLRLLRSIRRMLSV